MSAFTIGSVKIRIGADTTALTNDLAKAGRSLKKSGKELQRIGETMAIGISLPLGLAGGAAIKLASDVQESLNKVDVAFKSSSEVVKQFSKTSLQSFGLSGGSALEMASLFGDMATSMGISTTEAANMSTTLVGLAGDLSSFKNIATSEAQTALAGIFTGETESLKRLGIVMLDTQVKSFAMSQGFRGNWEQASQAEKVFYRYQFVLNATKNAQGDFQRTSGGAANQTRIFQENLKEIGATLGNVLLPKYTAFLQTLNQTATKFNNLNQGQKEAVVNTAGMATAIGPLIFAYGKIKEVFGDLLTKLPKVGSNLGRLTGLGLVFVGLWNNFDVVVTSFQNLAAKIGFTIPKLDILKTLWEGFNGAIRTGVGIIYVSIATLIELVKVIGKSSQALSTFIQQVVNPFDGKSPSDAWEDLTKNISSNFSNFGKNIKNDFLTAVGFISDSEIKAPKIGGLRGVGGLSGEAASIAPTGGNKAAGGGAKSTSNEHREQFEVVSLQSLGTLQVFNKEMAAANLIFQDTQSKLAAVNSQYKFLNDDSGKAAAQQSILKDALVQVGELGLTPQNAQVGQLIGQYTALGAKVDEVKTKTDAFGVSVASSIPVDFTGLLQGVGEALGGLFSGDAGSGNFFKKILGALGSFMQTLGSQLLVASKALAALQTLNPALMAIGGIALIAAGTAIQSLAARGPKGPSLAVGTDRVYRDGYAFLHAGEEVRTAAQVRGGGNSGGSGGGYIMGELQGDKMYLLAENSRKYKLNRLR
jgi:hypothetical protein